MESRTEESGVPTPIMDDCAPGPGIEELMMHLEWHKHEVELLRMALSECTTERNKLALRNQQLEQEKAYLERKLNRFTTGR